MQASRLWNLLLRQGWLVWVICFGLSFTPEMGAAARSKIILDTDIGGDIDDAWALAFVLSNPDFDPVGITICDGNTPARAKVACKMVNLTGRNNIPVAVGRRTHLGKEYQFAWAEDFEDLKPVGQSAADFLVENLRRSPGEITVIAVGPLQNLADALRREPKLGKLAKRVVMMSGCIYGRAGDQPVVPEWNVVAAIKDAQLVYNAGFPLTIVPLDSTTHVVLNDEERDRVRKSNSALTYGLECLYRLWITNPDARMTLHDQMAVAEAANPGSFYGQRETLSLVVDEKGFTRVDADRGKPVMVCLQPKREEFMKFYLSVLTRQNPVR